MKVNVLNGDLNFNTSETIEENNIRKGSERLAYKVVNDQTVSHRCTMFDIQCMKDIQCIYL